MAGGDMLLYGGKAINAIPLLFAEEKVWAAESIPNPSLSPRQMRILGEEGYVAPRADHERMKLNAYRLMDRVHIQSLDAAGLITAEIESGLPELLRARLKQVRETE